MNNNVIEICFNYADEYTLKNSILKDNQIIVFLNDFVIGDISDININLDIDFSKKIRIYSSKNNIQEYLSFIYLCNILKNNDIFVVFIDDFLEEANSLGNIAPDEIGEVLKYEKKLTKSEIASYKNEWKNLVKENGDIRLFKNKKVISVPFNYLDNYIKECIVNNDNDMTVAHMMLNDIENHFSDNVCYSLLNKYLKRTSK